MHHSDAMHIIHTTALQDTLIYHREVHGRVRIDAPQRCKRQTEADDRRQHQRADEPVSALDALVDSLGAAYALRTV